MEQNRLLTAMIMAYIREDCEETELVERLRCMSGPEEVFYHVKLFKEKGNDLFKRGDFELAYENYEIGVKLLSCTLPSCDENLFQDLAFSLNLNLAACAIKLKSFERARALCSLVLDFDPKNVKARFRRALANIEVGLLVESRWDLEKMLELEPRNKDVLRELDRLKTINGNLPKRKKSQEGMLESDQDRKGKKALVMNSGNSPIVEGSNGLKSNDDELEKIYRHDKDQSLVDEGKVQMSCNRSFVADNFSCGSSFSHSCYSVGTVNSTSTVCGNNNSTTYQGESDVVESDVWSSRSESPHFQKNGGCKSYVDVDDSFVGVDESCVGIPEQKVPDLCFSNKRYRGSSLNLSPAVYKMIAMRKEVIFYNKRQYSVLKVRALSSVKRANESDTEMAMDNCEDPAQGTTSVSHSIMGAAEDACLAMEVIDPSLEDKSMNPTLHDLEIMEEESNLTTASFSQAAQEQSSVTFHFSSTSKHRVHFNKAHPNMTQFRSKTWLVNSCFFKNSGKVRVLSNIVCGCRGLTGSKRKGLASRQEDPDIHRRKKLAQSSSLSCISFNSLFSMVDVGGT